ncbi:MAG: hypothetical protein ABSE51_19980 [Terracidiphilus sp.]|jgi:hypothetical protein
MDLQTASSTADLSVASPLYFHARYGAYECMGCYELIEIPYKATLVDGKERVRIKDNPENLVIWQEMMELDHQPCMAFSDVKMAQDAREHRKQQHRYAERHAA